MENKNQFNWSSKDVKDLTRDFIDHIYYNYYKSYKKDSEYYQWLNNFIFTIVTLIGFFVTIIIGLKEIFKEEMNNDLNLIFTTIIFILPSVSSVLLIFWMKKGYKIKEEIREQARINCKYIINDARISFSNIENDEGFIKLYKNLNYKIRKLQLSQSESYFDSHNDMKDLNQNNCNNN